MLALQLPGTSMLPLIKFTAGPAQALSMLFWSLGEISQGTTDAEFNLTAEAPGLLNYLGVAVQQQAACLGFQVGAGL